MRAMQNTAPQFTRTHILLGDKGLQRLADKHVFVAGLGGVGSYCVESLARAGIGRLTLIDHDVVAISNINRQLLALHSTIGQSKAELMRARVADINPACKITILKTFLTIDNVNDLVPPDSDYVIDCIDSLSCKVALVAESLKHGFNVASSMGAGNRLDPSGLKIADIIKTEVCPLARLIRMRLRRENIYKPMLTVYSDEASSAPLPPQPVEGPGRARAVNGTISYMTALFGMMLAGAVINRLLEQPPTLPPPP